MSERARALLPAGILVIALSVWVALGWGERDMFVTVEPGAAAPEFEARDFDGRRVRLSDFRGKVVMLNIWATWCPPCVWELPAMERLYREHRDEGFEIVAVSVDVEPGGPGAFGVPAADVRAFVEERGLTFPVLLDPERGIERTYRVRGLPTTFLIDRDGVIRRARLGPAEWDQPPYSEWVRALLEE